MSRDNNDMMALLAQILGGEPIEITRVEFTAEGREFIVYNAEGDAWGGALNDHSLSVETLKETLLKDVNSGALGLHFSIYQPVPVDELAERRAHNTDWVDIYVA